MNAVARAGGDPRRIGKSSPAGSKTKPRNGRFNAHGRGAKVVRTLPRDNGWKFDASSGQRLRMRRVIVKARVVKLKGPGSRASYAHVRYLQRDGVSREGEPGQLYGRALDHPDGPAFLDRSADDPTSVPPDRSAGGWRRAGRPSRVYPRADRPDGTRPGNAARLDRGRSSQHRPSPQPYRGAWGDGGRQGPQHRRGLHRPRHPLPGQRNPHPRAWLAERAGGGTAA